METRPTGYLATYVILAQQSQSLSLNASPHSRTGVVIPIIGACSILYGSMHP